MLNAKIWSIIRMTKPTLSTSCAGYHINITLRTKMFVDRENQFAHNVLQSSIKSYQIFNLTKSNVPVLKTILPPASVEQEPQLTQTDDIEVLFNELCTLVGYCVANESSLKEPRFEPFIKSFCKNLHKLSDEQLLETLRQIAQLPVVESTRENNYMELWNALDIECCRRIQKWSTAELLLVCDAWYLLGLARIGAFVWQALRKIGRKVRKMPPEQLVQSMFFCNVLRRPIFEMFDFEVNLMKCVEQMTLSELGVMSMGFFKTQTQICNPELLAHLYKRLLAELDTVEDITLVTILKVLRYSSKLQHVDSMMQLLHALRSQVGRISLLSCLHVALLGSDLQTCDDTLIEQILLRFERELDTVRLKDIERICLVMSLYNFKSESGVERRLCERMLPLMRERVDEILRYPRCYSNCLHFLSVMGYYDIDMLKTAMEPRFTKHAHKNTLLGREYFHLDGFIRINLRDDNYTGMYLTDKQRRTMGKFYTQYIPVRSSKFKLNTTDRILVEIKEATNTFVRELSFKHILPHYERCDLVICYDTKERRALPLDANCPEDYSGVILTRNHLLGDREAAHISTLAVVISGWNNVIRDKARHTGLFDLKLKQLRLLGHTPIVIFWHEWRELETAKDRQNFLKRRLAAVVNL